MRINEIAGDKTRSLLIGDVASDAFDPSTPQQPIHVGLMIDLFALRVVPVIETIITSNKKERGALTRMAIRYHQETSRGVVPLFGPISAYALIEPGQSGHLIAPYDVEGKRRGPLREVTWLSDVTLMEGSPSNNLNPMTS